MMNEILDARWSESVRRLALGIEPRDPMLDERIGRPVQVAIDGVPEPLPARLRDPGASPWEVPDVLAKLDRRNTGRFVILYRDGVTDPVSLRFRDPTERFVPRRLRIRLPDPASLGRVIRPSLFPGAAYDVPTGAMGLRGRILRDGAPLRWARAEARRLEDDVRVGVAFGDHAGEFLLLLDPTASTGAELVLPIRLRVTVFGPDPAPDPAAPGALDDPLWDLPVEEVVNAAAGDAVLAGDTLPTGYVSRPGSVREVEFGLSGLVREEFTFS
jgi:hypothetical protein